LQNNFSNSNFNWKFDYKFGMQGLSLEAKNECFEGKTKVFFIFISVLVFKSKTIITYSGSILFFHNYFCIWQLGNYENSKFLPDQIKIRKSDSVTTCERQKSGN